MANKPLKTIKFPELPDTYTIPQIDPTPTQGSNNAVSSGGVYEALQIVEHQISPTWIAGGLINKETGEFTESSDTNWTYTQLCEIPRSSKIRLSVYASGKAAGVAFYDSEETFISGTSVTSKANTDLREYDVPSNAVFARFTNVIGSNYHPDTPLIILLSDKTDAIYDEIIAKIPQVDATPTQNSVNAVSSGGVYDALQNVDVAEYQISPAWFTGGLVNKQENGVITESADANWTYTQFYKIPDTSSKVRLSVYASGKGLGIAFYTSTGTFISGTNITSKSNADLREYDIPTNAVFVRFTNNIASSYHPDTPLIIFLRNKTSVILEDKKESKYKQLIWRTGIQLNGTYSTSGTRMCTVDPISIDKPTRISLADDWRAWVSYYKNGTWVKDGTSARYDAYVPEPGYDIYITLAKRDNSAITDEELATASEFIAVILTDKYEEVRKAEQYSPNWASVSLFQKIGVLGDSFASGSLHYPDGSGSETNYAVSWGQILARDTGASVTNYSKGGLSATTWLTNTEYGLEKLLSEDPEQLYICDFGINDWNQRSTYPIGTIADCKEDYTENPQTFYGSYGKIIGNIIDHAPNAKIVILSVMRNNERQIDGDIETIAEHFGLPFIKLTDDDFFVSEYYAQSMYGNHPLTHGYAGTAEAVKRLLCKCIMKNTDYFRTYYDGEISDLETEISQIVPGLSSEAKVALLACFEHVAWVDEHGQTYYDALYNALYNSSGSGYAWSAASGVAPIGMTYESIAFAENNEYATITKPVLFAGYGDKEIEIEMAVVSGGDTFASIGVVDKYNYGCRLTFSDGKPMLVAEHDNHSEKTYTVDGIDITQFNKYNISLNNGRVTFKINGEVISTGNAYRNAYWGQPIISASSPVLQTHYELVAKIKSIRYNNYGASNNKKVLKYYRNKGVIIGGSELSDNTKRITTDLFYFPASHSVTVRLTGVVENNVQFTIKIIDQNGNVWQGSRVEEYNQGFFEPDLPVIPASQNPILWTNTEDELTTATFKKDTATEWTYGKLQRTNGTLRILFADGQSTDNELNRAISGSVFINGEEYVLEEGVY